MRKKIEDKIKLCIISGVDSHEEIVNDADVRPHLGIVLPTHLHERPALIVEVWQSFGSHAAFDGRPKIVFRTTRLEVARQCYRTRAYVPEEDTERVDVYRVVVLRVEHLRTHVYRCANDRARHHRFGLAEAQVRDFSSILLV